MKAKRIARMLILCLLLPVCCWPAVAAPPWEGLLSFSRVEADPEKDYHLGEEHGPWMIMACSFSGEGARQQARELVLELRKRYKVEAYTYEMKFDFDHERGRGVDRFGAPLRMRHRRGSQLQEVAVLAGDYPAVDDPQAQQTLRKLKYARPKCLEPKDRGRTNQTLAGWREIHKRAKHVLAPGGDKDKKGRMGHAFITTNPLLPKDYYVPEGLDELVIKMNKNVLHSLLDCPGKYTVQVARFTGKVVIKQREIEDIERGKQFNSGLAEAAKKAHRLTEALRMKGYDAYEFHDRYASIVTVGSFDWAVKTRADGKTEINPKIRLIMTTFAAGQQSPIPGAAGMSVKSLAGVPFDIQPIPVQVPKRSVSAGINRQSAGLRWK